MDLPPILKSVVGWLRAGYPEGVPQHDYYPIFALLGSHLTDGDINAIADELASGADLVTAEAIHAAVKETTHGQPLNVDLARVSARLAAGGWPLAAPAEAEAETEHQS